ncbi:MAG: alkaline phosphatase D family protein [Pseudobdellovibrionaceae bacterium]
MKSVLFFLFLGLLASCSGPKVQSASTEASLAQVLVAPVAPEKTLSRITFGSCAHQKNPQPIWSTLLADQPDLYIAMGDNIYASKSEDQPIAEQYKLQAKVPEFQKFRSLVPIVATWDDHDFGLNDGGAKNPKLDEARAAFLEFFPYDATRISKQQKGVYHSFVFGEAPRRVNVILLDTRTFRSELEANPKPKSSMDKFVPTKNRKKTILGSEQWKWLEDELRKPAELRILVSSIQVIAEEHGFEKWANFPHERKRLFDLIKKTRAKNLLIVSGDRHLSEVSKLSLKGYGDLYDVTASSINRPGSIESEKNKHRMGSLYSKENFGEVVLDWEHKQALVEVKDINGQKLQEFTLNLK